jgi:pyruvate/2-oxoglutarate dehydrogenase complex dihydrolipoamide acyltransferase (E2) component
MSSEMDHESRDSDGPEAAAAAAEEDEEDEEAANSSDSASSESDADTDECDSSQDDSVDEEAELSDSADESDSDRLKARSAYARRRASVHNVTLTSVGDPVANRRQSGTVQLDARSQQRATGREVIYIRVPHSMTSAKAQRKLKRQLGSAYPGTLIVLDDSPAKAPFVDRAPFSLLWQRIRDGRVDCIWIPRPSHISRSKEAFEMFEWMCDEHRVPVLTASSLEVAIKAGARTNSI